MPGNYQQDNKMPRRDRSKKRDTDKEGGEESRISNSEATPGEITEDTDRREEDSGNIDFQSLMLFMREMKEKISQQNQELVQRVEIQTEEFKKQLTGKKR